MDANIYLVGFMGTGKTTVGTLLARRLGRRFLELDELIEQREEMPIVDIFSAKGEPYFRAVEKDVLRGVSGQKNLVASCGGGIVIDQECVSLMKNTGTIICLQADADTIYQRIKRSSHRPLLNVENSKERIQELLEARYPFYQKADAFINTNTLSIEGVVQKIIDRIRDG